MHRLYVFDSAPVTLCKLVRELRAEEPFAMLSGTKIMHKINKHTPKLNLDPFGVSEREVAITFDLKGPCGEQLLAEAALKELLLRFPRRMAQPELTTLRFFCPAKERDTC